MNNLITIQIILNLYLQIFKFTTTKVEIFGIKNFLIISFHCFSLNEKQFVYYF